MGTTGTALTWIDPRSIQPLLNLDVGTRRVLALRHGCRLRLPEFWGDDPVLPSSAVMLRRGDVGWEAYGAGRAGPAVRFLSELQGNVALLAPAAWEKPLRNLVGPLNRGAIVQRRLARGFRVRPLNGTPLVRMLTKDDARLVHDFAPAWAWRTRRQPIDLIRAGAFGIPHGSGLAAISWVSEADEIQDAISIFVDARFRRLGLGTFAAAALVRHVVERKRFPTWFHSPENTTSERIARRLGFESAATSPVLRWSRD